jgi:hypothetical protein
MSYFWNGWQGELPQWKSYHEKEILPQMPWLFAGDYIL